MRTIFFGTPPFAANVLSLLIQNHVDVVAVVTKPDRPKGRSSLPAFSAVKEEVLRYHPSLPLHQPEKASTESFASLLTSYAPDLFIVVAYGEIMKQNLLDIPKVCAMNLHVSLLPRYRGASPMQWALLQGDRETGVTVIEMALKMDAGAILKQKKIALSEEITLGELEEKMAPLSLSALLEVIEEYEKGRITKKVQDETLATYVTKITPDVLKINWRKKATEIHNQIRAFSPHPGAFCEVEWGGERKRLKVYRSKVVSYPVSFSPPPPGTTLSYGHEGWHVACGEGVLGLLHVQIEGKRKMEAQEFIRGAEPPLFALSP